MKQTAFQIIRTLLIVGFITATAVAKDKEIQLKDAPAGVQATIQKTIDAGATLEKVEIKEESGGTQYDAKISDKNGLRWEIKMTAEGAVLKTDQKKAKK